MSEETPKKKKTNNNRSAQKANRVSFSTWEGHSLTNAEAQFIDEYIKTNNGRDSYIKAYPNGNPKNAHQNAYRLLNKGYIISEINHRLQEAKDDSIAEAEEIMQYFTSVMRGEIKDQFNLDASLSERTKAAQELAKRKIDIAQRASGVSEAPELKITLNWER